MTSPALVCAPRVAGLAFRSVAAPGMHCRTQASAYRLAGSACGCLRGVSGFRLPSLSGAITPLRGPN